MTRRIKEQAISLGFLDCGISESRFLSEEESGLKNYLDKKFHGQMNFMENHFEKRLNPKFLVDGSKSVISLLFNYYTSKKQIDPEAPVISKYAFGKDYHSVIKNKLFKLLHFIKSMDSKTNGRVFVDSAPVLERTWAILAGLGWIGKNGILINKEFGSFFFIAEIIVDTELEYNKNKAQNYCGRCTRCIDACPTLAIVEPGMVDARKCISYLTIEQKNQIPEEFKLNMKNRVFGCDICQDACPFNKKSKEHNEVDFIPSEELMEMSKEQWFGLDEKMFKKLFKESPVRRAKFSGIRRNIDFLKP